MGTTEMRFIENDTKPMKTRVKRRESFRDFREYKRNSSILDCQFVNIYINIDMYIYSLTRATLMSPGKDETRVCGYIYSIYRGRNRLFLMHPFNKF